MQAPKNGFFYVLDRATGELISAAAHAAVNWATGIDLDTGRPIEVAAARYPDGKPVRVQPGSTGGHGWYPMAFDAGSGRVFLVSNNNSQVYGDEPGWTFARGYLSGATCSFCAPIDQPVSLPLAPSGNFLTAWDPAAQAALWRTPVEGPRGGVLATAGGLVFHGDGAARFAAYDARDGRMLWRFATQNPVIAAPVSYAVGGEQYVALAVGEGYASLIDGPVPYPAAVPNTNRVLAFKLDAAATLPPVDYDPPPLPAPPALPAAADDATLRHGWERYHRFCFHCHGFYAQGDKVQPDLRFSDMLADADAWHDVVRGGVRAFNGMMAFDRVLSAEDAEAIRLYVIGEARKADTSGAVRPLQ
jgi:mono/diheme cytochrome c family protein